MSDFQELVDIIRGVRRRWRLKLAVRGAAGIAGVGAAVLLLGAYALEAWRFTPAAIIGFRIVVAASVVGLTAYFLVRPLLRRVSDEQVALYLEEHEPSLQAAIISAVEASRTGGNPSRSTGLVRRLVASAVEKCREIDGGRGVERTPLRQYAGVTIAIVLASAAVFLLGPGYLRHALSALVLVSRDVEAAAPYRIDVTPGNATVHRGADQTITAKLDGFDADQAVLMVRKTADAAFERLPLVRGDGNQYEGMVFDLKAPVDYFVEASAVRSPIYRLNVVDLPYVQRLELEYRFPAYTGLPPRKVEDGGDIAVLRGTEVRVRVVPTMETHGGHVLLHDSARAPLEAQPDGALTTSFKVDRDGFYRVELDASTGDRVAASPQYTIDVLADQDPTVTISKPGRDTTASPIEEVFVEARAEDDYGIRDLDLVYSVNGGSEKAVRLFDGRKRLPEVSAGHTFYLEELDVKPGDFVSYYARAMDNDAVQGPKRATSDMYFVRIRPLKKEFRQAPSQAGGGGGGGGEVGALSEQQRKIISATFNVQRDRKKVTAGKLRESSIVIALSQARLREQVEGLVTRMNSRLVQQDPSFKKIAELLPQAAAEMKAAEAKLREPSPDAALPPEQRALQFLQKAEEEYELQVSVSRQQGGGGGGAGSIAEDLADLFELELDRMANQYETSQRASQQSADQKIDELAEKLKELARRQEQEAERQRRRAAAGQPQGGGGGSQRDLAEQAEEMARRLEQLSRDENRAELMNSARRLREAADAMRRAAANGSQASAAESAAALERLRDAERKLQQSQSGRAERDIKDAVRQAEELAQEQRQIAEDVDGVEPTGEGRQQKVQRLNERKQALEAKIGALEKQLDRSAADIRQNERDAARKLSEAANSIRDNRVRDKIRYSQSLLRAGVSPADERAMENEIGSNLDDLRQKVGEAASALGRSKPDNMSEALEKARQLARGMESLDQRMRERTGRSGRNPQDQQSQNSRGQSNQRGQPGEQGAEGQQGQAGEQGRSGQQGQQGQRGQQGGRAEGQQAQQGGGDDNDGGNAIGDTRGPWQAGGGFGDRRPGGRMSSEDIRQLRGELRQWTGEAEQLRRLLQNQKIGTRELEEILRGLRALQDDRVYQNAGELERLQSAVTESMKRFEYTLRRRAEGNDQVLLSGSDDVPEQFRKLVEQYYKSLSKAPEKK